MSKTVIIPECNKDIGGMKEELSASPTEKKDGAIGLFSRLLRFDALSKRKSLESPTAGEPPTTYYGVYIPCEIKKGPDEEALHVYKNKYDALELVRRYKLARFKAFRNHQDAVSFALRGAEPTDTTDGNDNSLMGEKPYPFKAPSPQDMVALRKAIEAGLAGTVRDRVWDNPRFLVSSGNTPAIMQEGSRYNALHVSAKAMNAEICNLILTTVGNPAFVQTLYGADADADACNEFAGILVDRYLNTPDKGLNETPLHFAAKFGAEEAVDVLTSYPQCNIAAVNKFGEQAKDIICKRCTSHDPEAVRRISSLLQQRFYVPVLHCEDGSAAPSIGRPFTPAHPPEINNDPLSPRYEIRAYAGPMDAGGADSFRRRWKTPRASPRPQPPTFRLREMSKGLETVGRSLAEQMNVGWKEYWPFLDTFTDLRTPEGLALLEDYLGAKYEGACSLAYGDSCARSRLSRLSRLSPDHLSISRISVDTPRRSPAPAPAAPAAPLSPMSELCVALQTFKISADRPPHWQKTDPIRQRACRQPDVKLVANGEATSTSHTVSQLLCIERTCQVFAKRIADAVTFSLASEPEAGREHLRAEARHLQHTMCTYMRDERFQRIDISLTHSRLAQLVVHALRQRTSETRDVTGLLEFLAKLRCPDDDIFSSDDERRSISKLSVRSQLTHASDEHVRCLAGFVCDELGGGAAGRGRGRGPAGSEGECSQRWGAAARCRCGWAVGLERSTKRSASFRKNRSLTAAYAKGDIIIRRLTFDHDIGDGKLQPNEKEVPASANSPAGDPGAAVYTVDTAKCQVVEAEISDDESVASCQSEAAEEEDGEGEVGEEEYQTASEHSERDEEYDMAEASDAALAEPYIYGEEPTKIDRLVFDALSECTISPDSYPHVYRWRHSVALHPPAQRDKWHEACISEEYSMSPCNVSSWSVGVSSAGRSPAARARCSTPNRDGPREDSARGVPLQISTWLRVTGPNSPRSALAAKNVGHNISFGF